MTIKNKNKIKNNVNGWDRMIGKVEEELEYLREQSAKIEQLERELEHLHRCKELVPWNPSASKNLEF